MLKYSSVLECCDIRVYIDTISLYLYSSARVPEISKVDTRVLGIEYKLAQGPRNLGSISFSAARRCCSLHTCQ